MVCLCYSGKSRVSTARGRRDLLSRSCIPSTFLDLPFANPHKKKLGSERFTR